jgi:F0F1-type ATP synthase assembly protein I
VRECQAVWCDGDVGRRALSKSAGAVVVTAAFASLVPSDMAGRASTLAGGESALSACMYIYKIYYLHAQET